METARHLTPVSWLSADSTTLKESTPRLRLEGFSSHATSKNFLIFFSSLFRSAGANPQKCLPGPAQWAHHGPGQPAGSSPVLCLGSPLAPGNPRPHEPPPTAVTRCSPRHTDPPRGPRAVPAPPPQPTPRLSGDPGIRLRPGARLGEEADGAQGFPGRGGSRLATPVPAAEGWGGGGGLRATSPGGLTFEEAQRQSVQLLQREAPAPLRAQRRLLPRRLTAGLRLARGAGARSAPPRRGLPLPRPRFTVRHLGVGAQRQPVHRDLEPVRAQHHRHPPAAAAASTRPPPPAPLRRPRPDFLSPPTRNFRPRPRRSPTAAPAAPPPRQRPPPRPRPFPNGRRRAWRRPVLRLRAGARRVPLARRRWPLGPLRCLAAPALPALPGPRGLTPARGGLPQPLGDGAENKLAPCPPGTGGRAAPAGPGGSCPEAAGLLAPETFGLPAPDRRPSSAAALKCQGAGGYVSVWGELPVNALRALFGCFAEGSSDFSAALIHRLKAFCSSWKVVWGLPPTSLNSSQETCFRPHTGKERNEPEKKREEYKGITSSRAVSAISSPPCDHETRFTTILLSCAMQGESVAPTYISGGLFPAQAILLTGFQERLR